MLKGGDTGPALVPGKAGREPARQGDPPRGRPQDAAQGQAAGRRDRRLREVDRRGAADPRDGAARTAGAHRLDEGPRSSGRSSRRKPAPPAVEGRLGETPIDRFILAKLEREGAHARSAPPTSGRSIRRADVRPDRPAADAGGGRGVRRTTSRRTRTPKLVDRLLGVAALRRALGPALARRGPLRRGPGPHLRRQAERRAPGATATG